MDWDGNGWSELVHIVHKHNPDISIRKPEATSLSRTINFNKIYVNIFFDKYPILLDKYKFEPHNIYNVDKTGIITVQTPIKVVGTKGKEQTSAITSAERGSLVTMCLPVSGCGDSVRPCLCFPELIIVTISLEVDLLVSTTLLPQTTAFRSWGLWSIQNADKHCNLFLDKKQPR